MFRILEGDCVEQMRTLAASSVDAIVTDPPYGLEFMGKEWDAPWKKAGIREQGSGAGKSPASEPASRRKTDHRQIFDGTLKMSNENPYLRSRVRSGNGSGYGADEHVMQALQAWHYAWAREALRVLKPGGHLLAFGGSRTYHRLASAIEDAGFEIRDQIAYFYSSEVDRDEFLDTLSPEQQEIFLKTFGRPSMLDWCYGSGFPKSLDVSKAIDKAARGVPQGGADPTSPHHGEFKGGCSEENPSGRGFGAGPGQFMRPGLKPAPILDQEDRGLKAPAPSEKLKTDHCSLTTDNWRGWGTALKPAHEPIVVARKPLIGTVAANVLEHGAGALNIDGCRVGYESTSNPATNPLYRVEQGYRTQVGSDAGGSSFSIKPEGGEITANALGRWPANVIHDGSQEVVSLFPQSASGGNCVKRSTGAENGGQTGPAYGAESRPAGTPMIAYCGAGSAARFFYQVKTVLSSQFSVKNPERSRQPAGSMRPRTRRRMGKRSVETRARTLALQPAGRPALRRRPGTGTLPISP